MSRVKFLRNPDPASIGDNVEQFLQFLDGPACLLLEGEDKTRCRAFVTLSHGNEPSGAMALFRWLKSGAQPAVNIVCLLGSVRTALTPPLFTHRQPQGERDLNRCFKPPFDDKQGALAEEMLEILRLHHPEAVIDMHNTSGSGPAFGVATFMDHHHDALVSLFTQRLLITGINLGSLMEISEHMYPTVTVEMGGRLDDEAHRQAFEGLERYFTADQVLSSREEKDWGLELLFDPVRLELQPHSSLAYADGPNGADVTLRTDIEHLNFGVVAADTPLGWIKGEAVDYFRAQDKNGSCALARLIRVEDGVLYPAQALKLFMITNNATIARSDCLFYAVADDGQAI